MVSVPMSFVRSFMDLWVFRPCTEWAGVKHPRALPVPTIGAPPQQGWLCDFGSRCFLLALHITVDGLFQLFQREIDHDPFSDKVNHPQYIRLRAVG